MSFTKTILHIVHGIKFFQPEECVLVCSHCGKGLSEKCTDKCHYLWLYSILTMNRPSKLMLIVAIVCPHFNFCKINLT